MSNPGRPPVEQSRAVATTQPRLNVAEQNYITITDTIRGNNGAEAKAIRAMFGGDKKLMDAFLAVAFSALAGNSNLLYKATPMSIVQSIKDAAALGLKPDGIEGAIVCYGDVAKFMPMYQGYKRRMINSGKVMAVDAKTVYSEDEFDFETGPMGTQFRHHPRKAVFGEDGLVSSSRGTYQGFYAYARTPDGFVYFRYMDLAEVYRIRDTHGKIVSADGKPLPWATDFEQMALKTVIRQLQKDVPQEAVGAEMVRVERENDAALEALQSSVGKIDDGLSEVRQLALRAVGAGPPAEPETGASEPVASPEEALSDPAVVGLQEQAAAMAAMAPDPGADPNVRAAMEAASEQERLARYRQGKKP